MSNLSHGRQLLPTVIETRAKASPNKVWAKIPVLKNTSKGDTSVRLGPNYRDVTFGELAKAINQVAWILRNTLGEGTCFETVAYTGPTDIRYTIMVIAGIKVGYKVFLPSPQNSPAAYRSLLSQLTCRVLVTTDAESPLIFHNLEGYVMIKITIPRIEDLLDLPEVDYPFSREFGEGEFDPIFVLHTSGSTGTPKPITYTHGFIRQFISAASLVELDKENTFVLFDQYKAGYFYCMLPTFHAAGIAFSLLLPAYFDCIPVYPIPGAPPTVSDLIDVVSYVGSDWALLPPNAIVELSQRCDLLSLLASKIRHVMYIGGGVPQEAGDMVSSVIGLYQLFGSSECGLFPLIYSKTDADPKAWNYLQFHPSSGAKLQHFFEDTYELCICKDKKEEFHQPVFSLMPSEEEYRTGDLFKPHPNHPHMWSHCGRIDDIVVLLNGEKTNPIAFEAHVCSHPEVQSALIAGHQREEAILIVELKDSSTLTSEQVDRTIERLWPTIEEANKHCQAHARISTSHVILASPMKPFARTGKGTIQRQATCELYEEEINSMDARVLLTNSDSPRQSVDFTDLAAV